MSWQAYVDDTLVKSGHLDKAAILSLDGTSTWATTAGFQVSAEEGKALASILTTDAGKEAVWANGFHVGGERFVVTKAEGRSLYGRQGREGVCIVKTAQTLIVGHYGESHVAGNTANVVEKLADYLISLKY
ncbi:related to profilin [Cephalotrichum gorgonifer]|uniref:Profilin n=1 Tax=Cephalotrichum gorgonifer TaxID=2041049 RepID=A0AAE8N6X2_9PEZI|nr:related to profilin [Cephalotrichum gorgonifer]